MPLNRARQPRTQSHRESNGLSTMNHPTFHNRHTPSTSPTPPAAPGTRPPGAPRTTRSAPAPPIVAPSSHIPAQPAACPPKPRVVAPHTRVPAQPAARPMSGARLSAAACIPEPPPSWRQAPASPHSPQYASRRKLTPPCASHVARDAHSMLHPYATQRHAPPYAHRPCMARPPRHPLLSP